MYFPAYNCQSLARTSSTMVGTHMDQTVASCVSCNFQRMLLYWSLLLYLLFWAGTLLIICFSQMAYGKCNKAPCHIHNNFRFHRFYVIRSSGSVNMVCLRTLGIPTARRKEMVERHYHRNNEPILANTALSTDRSCLCIHKGPVQEVYRLYASR
jgi:hypothetical protein